MLFTIPDWLIFYVMCANISEAVSTSIRILHTRLYNCETNSALNITRQGADLKVVGKSYMLLRSPTRHRSSRCIVVYFVSYLQCG